MFERNLSLKRINEKLNDLLIIILFIIKNTELKS